MGARDFLYQALRDEQAMRKSYLTYAQRTVNNPELKEMFEEFAHHQAEHLKEIEDIIIKFFPRKP